jgi:hypothetical protein
MYFDEYLIFDKHVKHLCMKMSKFLYCLNKKKNFVSTDALKKLYFALVHSSLTYCINVYGLANKTILQPLILLLSFAETWLLIHERIPDKGLRNANDYYIPQPRIELVKRMPLFSFLSAWNTENNEKYTPSQPIYL